MNDLKFTTAGDYFNDTNSTIQELAQQAHEYSCAEYTKRLETETADKIFFNEIFNQKFAELVVRECIDTISDCSIEYCTRPLIVSEIKKHFGVEE